MRKDIAAWLCISSVTVVAPVIAEVISGRNLEGRKEFTIGISIGSAFDLEGEVNETYRPLDQFRDGGAPPEGYNWEELGFDDSYATMGIFAEKMWRYATLQFSLDHGNPKGDGVAFRDFYIGVDEVSYDGADYEYMKIPKGTAYNGSIDLYNVELAVNITPVSFESDEYYLTFTPWIRLGIFGFITDYDINAGPSTGLTQYENPPRTYVVGGSASGMNGLAIPEIGIGGEVRFALTDNTYISLEANLDYLAYDGDTGDFGVSARNEKAVEVDFIKPSLKATMEIMISDSVDLLIGAEYVMMSADAKVEAKDKPKEEVVALRERFNKNAEISMSTINLFAGLRF